MLWHLKKREGERERERPMVASTTSFEDRTGEARHRTCCVNSGRTGEARTEAASHNLVPFTFETQIFSGTHRTGFFHILDTVSQSHNSCILVLEEESREKQETIVPHCRNMRKEPKESRHHTPRNPFLGGQKKAVITLSTAFLGSEGLLAAHMAFVCPVFLKREKRSRRPWSLHLQFLTKRRRGPDITLATLRISHKQKDPVMPEVQQRFLKEELLVGHIFCSL
jgi:hypothetical protein